MPIQYFPGARCRGVGSAEALVRRVLLGPYAQLAVPQFPGFFLFIKEM
jgi:hypothetical protein